MSDLKEYIVTLTQGEDVDKFYDDMESPGGDLFIPSRKVEVANLRPISLNTHYYLTEQEAETLRKDPRVAAVAVPIDQNPNIEVLPLFEQTSSFWDKSSSVVLDHKNWGLYRCANGHVAGWGSNGVSQSVSGTVKVKAEGNGVDVVIVDGFIPQSHPEFAVNQDGTGGTRLVRFNWFSLNPTVTGQASGTYDYSGGLSADNLHGTHVAGTACGNSQGWARASTVYNISPYGNSNDVSNSVIFDYIRAFHAAKPVKRPTIVNCSYGLFYSEIPTSIVKRIVRRGVAYTAPGGGFSESVLRSHGIPIIYTSSTSGLRVFRLGARDTALDTDVASAIADGIIVVGAAGNQDETVVTPSSQDYNNYFTITSGGIDYDFPHQQGSSPASSSTVVCVGAVDSTSTETKAGYSNAGTRVDLFSPGTNIMSSANAAILSGYASAVDPRNSTFSFTKLSGTSMASPQVTGVLACLLEIYPKMNQAMAREYLSYYSSVGQLSDPGPNPTDYSQAYGLRGANNRYLKHRNERPDTGAIFPRRGFWLRKSSGFVYPITSNSTLRRS